MIAAATQRVGRRCHRLEAHDVVVAGGEHLRGGVALVEMHLDATVARYPAVAIGSYPRFDEADHRVKVTFDGRDEAQVRAALDFLKARIPREAIVRED